MMQDKLTVISEANPIAWITLLSISTTLIVVTLVGTLKGWGLESGIYFSAYGAIVYVIFYGGLAYSIYEFARVLINRDIYLISKNGCVEIFLQKSIKISNIRRTYIERKAFWNHLIIQEKNGSKTTIKSFLIKEDVSLVQKTISQLK